MSLFYTIAITFISALTPIMVFGQDDFKSVAYGLGDIFRTLVLPLLSTAAFVLFFWGLAQYVLAAGNQEAAESARQRIIAGLIGLFAIGALWGLIEIFGSIFSILPA